jgi:hypothetical protein
MILGDVTESRLHRQARSRFVILRWLGRTLRSTQNLSPRQQQVRAAGVEISKSEVASLYLSCGDPPLCPLHSMGRVSAHIHELARIFFQPSLTI